MASSKEHTVTIGTTPSPYLYMAPILALTFLFSWTPFDRSRDWPDLGSRFSASVEAGMRAAAAKSSQYHGADPADLDWSAVMKRTFEAYIRGERPNMYGEWIQW